MRLCRLFVASGLVCGLLLGPSFVDAQQESKSQSDATIAVPRLRRIVIHQHALCDTKNAEGLMATSTHIFPTALGLKLPTTSRKWTR